MAGLINAKTVELDKRVVALETATANIDETPGTVATVTGLSVIEVPGAMHKTILVLDEVVMNVVDGTTPATDGAYGTKKLYTFPVGNIQLYSGIASFPIGDIVAYSAGSGLTSTSDFKLGVGSVAVANDQAFGLASTTVNMVAAITVALTAFKNTEIETGKIVVLASFDGSSAAATVNLNMRTDADSDSGTAASTLTVSGTITLTWSKV